MSQPDNTPVWLAWIVPAGTVIAAAWAFLRRFFAMATREELKLAIESAQERIEERHRENKQDSADLKDEVSQLKIHGRSHRGTALRTLSKLGR